MITSVAIVIQPLLLFHFSQLPHTLTVGNAPLQSNVCDWSLCLLSIHHATLFVLTLICCLCSSLRSTLPYVHLTPWPGRDKRNQLTRSALWFHLSPSPLLLTCRSNLFNLPFFTPRFISLSPVPLFCWRAIQIMFTDWPHVKMCWSNTESVLEIERCDVRRSWGWNTLMAEVKLERCIISVIHIWAI